ncbi:MAG: PAS domain-containing protein [Kouleothrix sp.]|nr:PAS domain-containing protein [Kouleothrix sp.]
MSDTSSPSSPSDRRSFELLQRAIDALGDPIFVKDLAHRWVACNRAFCELLGRPYDAVIGRSDPDYFPPDQVTVFWDGDDQVVSTGETIESEELFSQKDGTVRTIWTRKFAVRDDAGRVVGSCGIITDISEIRRRQQQIEQLEAEIKQQMTIIEAQGSLLDELSVPVIQVWDSILLLPLIGVIESRRASRITESLLESIGREGAEVIIIDITGVPIVDTGVASHLVRTVQAAQLLGCQSILVGISPEIAQTLVGLGVDFSRITTRATLQNGLEYALKRLNYDVRRKA